MNTPTSLALVLACCSSSLSFLVKPGRAQETAAPVVVLSEAGLPSADSPAFPEKQLETALLGARFASAKELDSLLRESSTRLLVLPYGSAFPEENWSAIHAFLEHGGNLLLIGGRPFTRAAYHDDSGWRLRDYSVRFIRQLSMDQFQATPGSAGMEFQSNPDITIYLPGEPVEVEVVWHAAEKASGPLRIRITEFPEAQPAEREAQTANLSAPQTLLFPAPKEKGFHVIAAELLEGGKTRNVYRSGFWIRDTDFLRSGRHLKVNHDFFEVDGQPIPVVGTTYMSSEVHRLYV